MRRQSGTVCIMVLAASCLGVLLLTSPQDGGGELLGGSEHALAAEQLATTVLGRREQ